MLNECNRTFPLLKITRAETDEAIARGHFLSMLASFRQLGLRRTPWLPSGLPTKWFILSRDEYNKEVRLGGFQEREGQRTDPAGGQGQNQMAVY
jgi:hypothetical protein